MAVKRIESVPKTLEVMQSWLWFNETYKLFFSKHHTNNPQEFYCFFLHVASGIRKHGKYRLTTNHMLVQFLGSEYKVNYLVNMRRYDVVIIQLINVNNELDFINWIGITIPAEKGASYTVPPIISNSPLSFSNP